MKYLNPLNYINYLTKKIKNIKKIKNLIYKYSSGSIYSYKFLYKKLKQIKNINQLVNFHFSTYSHGDHINKKIFEILLSHPEKKSLNILETGSSAHGCNSSILFISYIYKFGGTFNTVDINPGIKKSLNHLAKKGINFHTSDSVTFINNLDASFVNKLDLVYLDSFDLDIENPNPAEEHGLMEFLSLEKNLRQGAYIAIDDTPNDIKLFGVEKNKYKYVPGKGALVLKHIEQNGGYEIIYHHYGVILKKL